MSQESNKYEQTCLSPGTVKLDLKLTIGASGAVSTVNGYGQDGAAKNTTGIYDVTLDRGYNALRCLTGSVQTANVAATALFVRPVAYTAGSTTLEIATIVNAGTATEPASGDVILLTAVFDELGI